MTTKPRTAYMREYMRRKRAALSGRDPRTISPAEWKHIQEIRAAAQQCPHCGGALWMHCCIACHGHVVVLTLLTEP